MKKLTTIFLLLFMINTQANAQMKFKIYSYEEMLVEHEKIDKQVALEAKEWRKEWAARNEDDYSDFVEDYVIETMIIDSTMTRKLSIAYRNTDFPIVIGEAYEGYDKLLNKYYKILMSSISNNSANALRKSQRAWLALRDANSDFMHEIFYEDNEYGREGQAYTTNMTSLNLLKTRVAELFDYCAGRPQYSTECGWH